jgi:hypothetical protein
MKQLIAFTIDLPDPRVDDAPASRAARSAHRDALQQTCQTDRGVEKLGLDDRDRSRTPL